MSNGILKRKYKLLNPLEALNNLHKNLMCVYNKRSNTVYFSVN